MCSTAFVLPIVEDKAKSLRRIPLDKEGPLQDGKVSGGPHKL